MEAGGKKATSGQIDYCQKDELIAMGVFGKDGDRLLTRACIDRTRSKVLN